MKKPYSPTAIHETAGQEILRPLHSTEEAYVTRSVKLFDLSTQGQDETKVVLSKLPALWPFGPCFPVDEG